MNPSNHSQMQCQRLKPIPRRQEATLQSHTYIKLIIKNMIFQLNTQSKLLFQKTEPNEPTGPISQPVQPVEEVLKKFQDLPHRVGNPTKQKECNSDSEWVRIDTNKAKYLNYYFEKLNLMNRLVWFPNQFIQLRKNLKFGQKIA